MPDNMHTGIELKKLHFWYSTFIIPDNMHTGIELKNLHFFVNDGQLKKRQIHAHYVYAYIQYVWLKIGYDKI